MFKGSKESSTYVISIKYYWNLNKMSVVLNIIYCVINTLNIILLSTFDSNNYYKLLFNTIKKKIT